MHPKQELHSQEVKAIVISNSAKDMTFPANH